MNSFKEVFGILEKNEDDDFFTLRSEFSNIYKNIYNINILKEYAIETMVNNIIVLWKNNNVGDIIQINVISINKYDIEFYLYLINILQECLRGNYFKNNHKNEDFILLRYYDTFNKGMEYIKSEEQKAIENTIKLYVSKQLLLYKGKYFYKVKILSYLFW